MIKAQEQEQLEGEALAQEVAVWLPEGWTAEWWLGHVRIEAPEGWLDWCSPGNFKPHLQEAVARIVAHMREHGAARRAFEMMGGGR